jgi:TetR/AcrR family transcriptional repressor of lmrAB and yxaGH operons
MKDRTQPDTRERLLRAGEQLFRTQGYSGTGLKQLTQTAEAPWGSLYHFFPEGKEQLGTEVLHYAGQLYGAGWQGVFKRYPNPGEAIEKVFLGEVTTLTRSDYRDGCPITSVTMDIASTSEALRQACADAYGGWLAQIETALRADGAPEDAARDLAGFVLSALEGAIALSRAAKDPAALLQSAKFVRQVIDREAAAWRAKAAG